MWNFVYTKDIKSYVMKCDYCIARGPPTLFTKNKKWIGVAKHRLKIIKTGACYYACNDCKNMRLNHVTGLSWECPYKGIKLNDKHKEVC